MERNKIMKISALEHFQGREKIQIVFYHDEVKTVWIWRESVR